MTKSRERTPWPQTWMNIAKSIANDRSHDPRLQVCAIIVPDDNSGILALGYNGDYNGGPNEVESLEPGMSGMIHAEVNALVKCPFHTPTKKYMYLTHSPCISCAKLIINAGISKVIYDTEYRDTSGINLLVSANVEVTSLSTISYLKS